MIMKVIIEIRMIVGIIPSRRLEIYESIGDTPLKREEPYLKEGAGNQPPLSSLAYGNWLSIIC